MVGKRYRILEQLGKGAFGTVYRAEVLAAGDFRKQVALKVLDYQGEAPEEIALRFRDEARILGLIRHRAIVGVDSLAELESGWAVVMEFVDGINISVVVKYGLPPARVAVGILEEVASALHAAYSTPSDVTGEPLKLVHRDIKPANIRLTAQGEVKVLDFGVARADFDSREARTQAMRFGSLRYMSPEAFDGIEGHATDVFALGIVYGELLAGQRLEEPPKNPDRYPAFLAQVEERARARIAPTLSPEQTQKVIQLCLSMIAFEPEDRPSARAVEMEARELASRLPGQSLRDWSEVNVPVLADRMARRKAKKEPADSVSSSILVERSSSQGFELPTGMASVGAPGGIGLDDTGSRATGTHTAAAAGAGAALGAGVAVLLVAVALLGGGGWMLYRYAERNHFFDDGPDLDEAIAAGTPELSPQPAPADPKPAVKPEPIPEPAPPPPEPSGTADPPAPAPAPVAAAAVTAPKPPPRPAPAPEPSGGSVTVEGDAARVELASASGSFPAGAVPAGTFRIMADFGTGNLVQAGTVTVRDGEDIVIRCYSVMLKCSKAK